MVDRAQSEVTGEILLVAIVVLSVSAFGVAYIDSVGVDRPTLAELSDVSGNNDSIEIAHTGGQTLTNDSVRIVLRNETTAVTLWLTDGQAGADQLEPGDVWRWDSWGALGLSGNEITVVVLTDDTVLLKTTKLRSV